MIVTTKEIAEACGVSRGSVDRALNNRPGINAETREHILRVARDMGYRPNLLARSLVVGRTKSIGVIVFDLYHTFFAQLLNSITTVAKEKGYFVYITLTEKEPGRELECVNHLLDGRVDGMIICPITKSAETLEPLQKASIPVATIMNRWDNQDFMHFGVNDRQAMLDSTRYVLGRGYDHIIYFSPPLAFESKTNIYSQKQRYMGFLDAMNSFGESKKVTLVTSRDYDAVVSAIDANPDRKNAVLCPSDIFAMEAMIYLKRKGIAVPYNAGVMGFDGVDIIRFQEPKLTTVSMDINALGETVVERLIEQIESGCRPTGSHFCDYSIVEGQTII